MKNKLISTHENFYKKYLVEKLKFVLKKVMFEIHTYIK